MDTTTLPRGTRERLPKVRPSWTYKLVIGGTLDVFVTLGTWPDGRLGEVFVDVAKEGSALRVALSSWAVAVSKALQYGMPAREAARTFRGVRCGGMGAGVISCEDVPAIHDQKSLSIWDAISRLIEAETDEGGRHRDFLGLSCSTQEQGDVGVSDEHGAATVRQDVPHTPPTPPLSCPTGGCGEDEDVTARKIAEAVVPVPRCPHGHGTAVLDVGDGWRQAFARACGVCDGAAVGGRFR